jgi:hypothetical protein
MPLPVMSNAELTVPQDTLRQDELDVLGEFGLKIGQAGQPPTVPVRACRW